MKIFSCGLLLFFSSGLFGQTTEWKRCGLDNESSLNEYEAKYFNEVFKNRKGNFDFTGKIIAYFTGSAGITKSTKSLYFSGARGADRWQARGTQLLILTKEEKEVSGGYDVILVSWSKLLKQGKARARLVRRVKNTFPKN